MFGKKKNLFFTAEISSSGGMEVRIDTDQIESPEHAGIAMADFLNHFANAFAFTGKAESPEEAKARIMALFLAEMENPTDTATGEIQN